MKEFLKKHWPIVLLVIVAAFVMLPKLDRPAFWQDEAEAALMARSINNGGIPVAWDGTNVVTQLSGNDSNSKYVWSFTPWLQFYVVAGSFKVLGETNFAGRLPFVIFGILGLIALYLFVYQTCGCRVIASLSAVLLFLNMQFILYSRQCKYYSILFLAPPILYLVYKKIDSSIRSFLLFVLFVAILFYTNYVSLFTCLIGLILYTFFVRKERRLIYRLLLAGVISILVTFPFFMIGGFGVSSSVISRLPSMGEYFDKLARHIWYFNNMAFPLILFVPFAYLYKNGFIPDKGRKLAKFLLWIIFPAWIFLPLFNQDVFRYNLHLVPLFSILTAMIIGGFFRKSKVWGTVFLILILTTNIFASFPTVLTQLGLKISGYKFEPKSEDVAKKFGKDLEKTRLYFQKVDREISEMTFAGILTHSVLKSEYAAYYNELTKNYPDAIQTTVDYLRENARDGDIVYANFDLLPLQFYLPNLKYAYQIDRSELKVPKDAPLPGYVTGLNDVDWYFFRDVKMNLGPYVQDEVFREIVSRKGWEIIPNPLGVSSLYWDVNWPQRYQQYINKMLWHKLDGYEEVILYTID